MDDPAEGHRLSGHDTILKTLLAKNHQSFCCASRINVTGKITRSPFDGDLGQSVPFFKTHRLTRPSLTLPQLNEDGTNEMSWLIDESANVETNRVGLCLQQGLIEQWIGQHDHRRFDLGRLF